MRIGSTFLAAILVLFFAAAREAQAGGAVSHGSCQKGCGSGCQKGCGYGCANGCGHGCTNGCGSGNICYTTKFVEKTIYESKTESHSKVVYDTVYDHKTVEDVRRVAETRYRQEEFTYQRPIFETRTKEVPFTVTWPVQETKSREVSYVSYAPSIEKRKRSVPHTTYRTITEQSYRTISYHVPRQVAYTKTVQVDNGRWETRITKCPALAPKHCSGGCAGCGDCGHQPQVTCERVWVPCLEQRHVTCHKTVYDVRTKQVPFTRTRLVPETHAREVEYCVKRMVPVTKTRTVYYTVTRTMSAQRTKHVNYTVKRMITEKGTRSVPYTVMQEVPCTRTVSVPRRVPRTVTYTVTRQVPRTVTCEVRVPVCCSNLPSHSEILHGEAELETPDASPSDDEPTPAAPSIDDETTQVPAKEFHLTSATQPSDPSAEMQSDHFETGMDHYRSGGFQAAADEFSNASKAAPANAKYAYYHALALQRAGKSTAAYQALAVAVELEKHAPVPNWGRVMQRVQGDLRIWLEDGRKQLADA